MTIKIKICGLTSIEAVNAAMKGRADYIGCVFYKYSPRNITPEYASVITQYVPSNIKKVALVSAYESDIKEIVKHFKPDMLQFHGQEPSKDIFKITRKYNLPIIKTIRISTFEDLAMMDEYSDVAQMYCFESDFNRRLLVDEPGKTFDWAILKKTKIDKPWILSGGLDKYNANYAIRVSGAQIVNASTSLESSPGIKSPDMIEDFINSVKKPNY